MMMVPVSLVLAFLCAVVLCTASLNAEAAGLRARGSVRAHGAGVSEACRRAYERCDFRFSGDQAIATVSLDGTPDTPASPRIVAKPRGDFANGTQQVGILNTNELPVEVILARFFLPLPAFQVTPRLSATHFKPFPVPFGTGSAVGFQTLVESQITALRGQCLRLFFTDYQIISSDATVLDNLVDVPRFRNKCVVFLVA